MPFPSSSKYLARELTLACLLCLGALSSASAATRKSEASFKVEVGEFVFVMLASRCVNEPTEVVMTKDEYEDLRELRRDRYLATLQGLVPESGHPLSLSDPCLSLSLTTEPSMSSSLGPLLRVEMPLFKQVYDRRLESRAGMPYPVSGLYPNDGSVEPLWTVTWHDANVLVSSDGIHLVRLFPLAGADNDPAVAFYKSGELLMAHRLSDLVDGSEALARSGSETAWHRQASLDDEKKLLFVATLNGEEYHFDLYDGRVVASKAMAEVQYTAMVRYRSGRTESLRSFHACAGSMLEYEMSRIDDSARNRFYGFRQPHFTPVGHDLRGFRDPLRPFMGHAVPFDRIRTIERMEQLVLPESPIYNGMDDRAWYVRTTDNRGGLLTVDVTRYRLCGTTRDGRKKTLALAEIEQITIEK